MSLEFRNSKWTLASPTERTLRDIGFVLLKILQEIDNNFLELHSVIAPIQHTKSLGTYEVLHNIHLVFSFFRDFFPIIYLPKNCHDQCEFVRLSYYIIVSIIYD